MVVASAAAPRVVSILVAAVAAEWARKAALYPLDTLTTRLQYSRRPVLLSAPSDITAKRVSQLEQAREVIRDGGGPLSLYQGLSTQLVGVVPTSLVYMPTYEAVSRLTRAVDGAQWGLPAALPASQLASVATGVASSCVRVPISVVKARLQLGLSPNAAHAVRTALATSGWRGLYAGWGATCALDVSYALVQFTALEWIRALSTTVVGRPLTTRENALVGFAVGVITSVATEPLDVVKTRLMGQRSRRPALAAQAAQQQRQQQQRAGGGDGGGGSDGGGGGGGGGGMRQRRLGGRRGSAEGCGVVGERAKDFGYTGLMHGLRRIVQQEGALALWRGLLPRLLLKSFGSMIWYPVYMFVLRVMAPVSA